MDVDWIARAIAIVGLIVAIVGAGARVFSLRRSASRQRPNLLGDIAHCMFSYGSDDRAQYLSIEIAISNLSDVANSIVEYGLLIGPPYNTSTRPIHHSENALGETILEYGPGSEIRPKPLALKGIKLDFLSNPLNLPAHESRIGWVGFPLPGVPADVAKAVIYVIWIVASEGEPLMLTVDSSNFDYEVIGCVSSDDVDDGV